MKTLARYKLKVVEFYFLKIYEDFSRQELINVKTWFHDLVYEFRNKSNVVDSCKMGDSSLTH